jgi:hypothetical protein
MIKASSLPKVLPLVLACGFLFSLTRVLAASQGSALPVGVSQAGWQDVKVWNFDDALELQDWTRRDESESDGGEYLWAESAYTYTTGIQSAWPLGSALTGTGDLPYTSTNGLPYSGTNVLPYPNNVDTWMVYSFTVPVINVYSTRLVFDWWLDAAPGDAFSWLTSTNGLDFTTVQTKSEQLGRWHTDETVDLAPEGYSGDYYIAFRFQSNGDGQSGLGSFVDHVRLQYQRGYPLWLPILFKRWPPIPHPPHLDSIDNTDGDGNYTVTWSYPYADPPVYTYTLEEATDTSFADPSTYYPLDSLTQTVSYKEPGTYYYRVRGHNDWGPGEWSAVQSVTVIPPPYTPTIEVEDVDFDGTYTVTWSYDYAFPPVVTYTLRESTDPDFTNPITYYPNVSVSQTISSRPLGTYYYAVRGHNVAGPGAWSDVHSVTVLSPLRDDFEDPRTGWTVRRTSSPYLNLASATYTDGKLVTRLRDRFDFAIFSSMFKAPDPPYRVAMKSRIVHLGNELSYGLIFGANDGTLCPVARDDAANPQGCFEHYYRLNVIWGGYLKYQVKRIDSHSRSDGGGRGDTLMGYDEVDGRDGDEWNTWEVRVYDEGFAVYLNGQLLGWTDDATYVHEPHFGIFISTYEYNAAAFEHELFHVRPLLPSESLPDGGYLVPGETNWYRPLPQAEQIE